MYLDSLVTANSVTHPDIFLAQLLLCQELEKELTLSSERIVRQTECNDKVIIYNCLLLVDLCFCFSGVLPAAVIYSTFTRCR